LDKVVKASRASVANAEQVLLEAFVEGVEDGKWGGQFGEELGTEE